ncbi:PREDICTED: uncharacterized protein LOC109584168 [Amphimedon queenslandica]|uniref:Uncharacterized protein n=1 Tax=Amphimedon queenslandica TaxID=400682 RepID=A0AAN0JF87_AMPQE|nr:PREDICTED: uncharacterized protein LOC109584168 [Amphimedon queenslandica]|eukprot:XP_019855343.1 PREDICTED: uncharacterized protein LOC109584168 [Amphimedon queenslandica]
MTLLNAIWKHFYSLKSGGEHGTLYQLRNLLGRTNVKKDPSKSFDECEDFLLTAIEGFIVTAAMHILRMKSLDDVPDSEVVPEDSWLNPELERKRILSEVTRDI